MNRLNMLKTNPINVVRKKHHLVGMYLIKRVYIELMRNVVIKIQQGGIIKTSTKELANANALNYGGDAPVDPEAVDEMVKELTDNADRRKSFQRRRRYYEDADVTYINRRNMVFNKKSRTGLWKIHV